MSKNLKYTESYKIAKKYYDAILPKGEYEAIIEKAQNLIEGYKNKDKNAH